MFKYPNHYLTLLNQQVIEATFYDGAMGKAQVKLLDKFTEEEVFVLYEHPEFENFTPDFRNKIQEAISVLIEHELKKDGPDGKEK
jgi:hypothetical protein